MTVCQCEEVGDDAIKAAIAGGAQSVNEVTDSCQAGGGCGRCWTFIEALLEASGRYDAVAA